MEIKRAHLFISGRVQGVSFRYYTQQQALNQGVSGWVRNLWDGRVEAVFEGTEADVEHMIRWCNRGPSSASVDHVDLIWEQPGNSFKDFRIRTTGG